MTDPHALSEIAKRGAGAGEVFAQVHAGLYHIGTNTQTGFCATLAEDGGVPDWHDAGMYPPNRIKELREDRGLTLEQLAEKVGTSHTQISRLEHGKRRLDINWMQRVAKALVCQPQDLMVPGALPAELAELAAIAADLTDAQRKAWINMAGLLKVAAQPPAPPRPKEAPAVAPAKRRARRAAAGG